MCIRDSPGAVGDRADRAGVLRDHDLQHDREGGRHWRAGAGDPVLPAAGVQAAINRRGGVMRERGRKAPFLDSVSA